jgi:hypothetical protein
VQTIFSLHAAIGLPAVLASRGGAARSCIILVESEPKRDVAPASTLALSFICLTFIKELVNVKLCFLFLFLFLPPRHSAMITRRFASNLFFKINIMYLEKLWLFWVQILLFVGQKRINICAFFQQSNTWFQWTITVRRKIKQSRQPQSPNAKSMAIERGWERGRQASDSDWSVCSPTPIGMAFKILKSYGLNPLYCVLVIKYFPLNICTVLKTGYTLSAHCNILVELIPPVFLTIILSLQYCISYCFAKFNCTLLPEIRYFLTRFRKL